MRWRCEPSRIHRAAWAARSSMALHRDRPVAGRRPLKPHTQVRILLSVPRTSRRRRSATRFKVIPTVPAPARRGGGSGGLRVSLLARRPEEATHADVTRLMTRAGRDPAEMGLIPIRPTDRHGDRFSCRSSSVSRASEITPPRSLCPIRADRGGLSPIRVSQVQFLSAAPGSVQRTSPEGAQHHGVRSSERGLRDVRLTQ